MLNRRWNNRLRKIVSVVLCVVILLEASPLQALAHTASEPVEYFPAATAYSAPVNSEAASPVALQSALESRSGTVFPASQPVPQPAPEGAGAKSLASDLAISGLPPTPPGFYGPLIAQSPARAMARHQETLAAGGGIALLSGWNLVSLPKELSNTNPAIVLSSIDGSYRRVYAYDACDVTDPWKLYDPANPQASDLTAIDHRLGLWIEMAGPATLNVAGTQPGDTLIQVCRGWNLIGYPVAMSVPVPGALASIEGRYDRVFTWEAVDASDPWEFYDVAAPGWANYLQTMKPGQGYWLHATSDTSLIMMAPRIPPSMAVPGFIAGPELRSTVSGQVPIVLAEGTTLRLATVDYWPANDLNAVQVLATGVDGVGGSTLATLDTTLLANGSYVIRVSGTDESGELVASGTMVTVEGEYKPGRVRFTINDLTVPVVGLPIVIGRTYDSLERNQMGDFGYGWSLAVSNPKLEVDPDHNVTLTMLGGRRVTFYFTPKSILGFLIPQYTPEAGVYGSLTANGCGLAVVSGGKHFCFPGGLYQESITAYTYADSYGREFKIGIGGTLHAIKDIYGNVLTFSADGITSSAGDLKVTFDRDDKGRISAITDVLGNVYSYSYDAAGDLVSVMVPDMPEPVVYSYNSDHYFLSAIDPRGNTTLANTYYPDGRLKSETDALGNVFQYAYDTDTRTTKQTNPDGGVAATVYNEHGNMVSHLDPLNRTTTFVYSSDNRLLSKTDALGHTTSYTYDGNGHQTSVTDPLGGTISVTNNEYGGMLSLTDPLGHTMIIPEDSDHRPIGVADSLGVLGEYTWDDHGNPLTRTDGNGKTTAFTYDLYGNLTSETDPLGNETSYTYDLMGRMLTRTDARGNTTEYSYDALGRVHVITEPLGLVTAYEYDANGNVAATTDPAGRRTTYTYDAADQLTRITYPDGTTQSYAYDWRGNVTSETDRAGHTTLTEYDLAGQMVRVTFAAGTEDEGSFAYGYDVAGRTVSTTDARGNTTTYTYDAAGHVLAVTDPLSNVTTYGYDSGGRPISVTDANGNQTAYTQDARGRLTKITYPDGTTSQRSYSATGRITNETDQAGRITTYTYDDAGRLTAVTNPMSQTTSYTYDAVGNLLSITDANGHQTTFAYDALNHRIRQAWPDGSFEAFNYDTAGNLISHRLADGYVNMYDYDMMNQLTQVNYFEGQTVSFSYTANGLRQSVTDEHGVTTYGYDQRDRLIGVTFPDGQAISYTYDAMGNRASLTTPAGTTSYGYDQANRLVGVTDPLDNTATYAYDGVGLRTQLSLPNSVTVDYGYDTLNRLISIVQRYGSMTLASYSYTLGPAGHRLGMTEADGSSIQWRYDDAYRLVEETHLDNSSAIIRQTAYTYDPVGNRLSMTINGQTTAYQYNELDQLMSTGTVRYTYDGRGNLAQIAEGTSVTDFVFDAADRLRQVSLPGGDSLGFDYDADGRRVSQTIGTQSTHYLWDETLSCAGGCGNGCGSGCCNGCDNVVLETDDSGTQLASYVLGGSELLYQDRGGTVSHYLHDGQGSVRALTDGAGNVTDLYRYAAYGELLSHQGTTVNPYLYTGQQYDELTDLYYLRARYYDPADSRFLSRDPAGYALRDPVESNLYVYARANPINFSDPTGLEAGVGVLNPPWPQPQGRAAPGAMGEYLMLFLMDVLEITSVVALGLTVRCLYIRIVSEVCGAAKQGWCLLMIELKFPSPDPCHFPICIFPGDPLTMPSVANHMQDAIDSCVHPMVLTYDSSKTNQNRRRRESGCTSFGSQRQYPSEQCDEYPFASTQEGGFGASIRGVPAWEHAIQGGVLGSCVKNKGIRSGDRFGVVVVPQCFGLRPQSPHWFE